MSNTRFIGCLHLGDEWMAKYRGFESSYEHDEWLIEHYNSVVNKRDIVYILGDITMEKKEHYHQLNRLNGRKIVVLGNHDLPKHIPELLKYVETVAGMIDYKGFCLTHAPIHPQEVMFYRGNIHAHIHHENKLPTLKFKSNYDDRPGIIETGTNNKYYCVDAHLIDYIPLTIDELINIKL